MKVFITGGTGYLGTVLVEHLLAAGHEVSALARSDRSVLQLTEAGALPVRGSLADLDALRDAAAAAEAVIHAAVDYSMTDEANAIELAAVGALLAGAATSAAAGSPTPVVFSSTGLVYGFDPAQSSSEDAVLPEISAQPVKVAAERLVLAAPDVAGIVIRAGLVFGRGGSGLITGLIGSAVANGAATYLDEATNTWLPVHVDDLADLYVRAVEHPVAGIYNAAGTVPFAFRDLAEAIGALTGTSAVSVPLAVAEQAFGPAARIMSTTGRLDASKARRVFGWAPSSRSLVDDVRSGSYVAPILPAAAERG